VCQGGRRVAELTLSCVSVGKKDSTEVTKKGVVWETIEKEKSGASRG